MDDKTARTLSIVAVALIFCVAAAALVLSAMNYTRLHSAKTLESYLQSGAMGSDDIDKAMEEAERQAGLRGKSVSATDFGGIGGVLGGGKHGANRSVSIDGVRLLDGPDWEIYDHTAVGSILGAIRNDERLHLQITQATGEGHATVLSFDLAVRLVAKKANPGPVSVGFNTGAEFLPAIVSKAKKELVFHHAAVVQAGPRAPMDVDVALSNGRDELGALALGAVGGIFGDLSYTKVAVSAVSIGEGLEEGEVVLLRAHGATPSFLVKG